MSEMSAPTTTLDERTLYARGSTRALELLGPSWVRSPPVLARQLCVNRSCKCLELLNSMKPTHDALNFAQRRPSLTITERR